MHMLDAKQTTIGHQVSVAEYCVRGVAGNMCGGGREFGTAEYTPNVGLSMGEKL